MPEVARRGCDDTVKWSRVPLGRVAPARPASRQFAPDEEVWHLGLEQIESQTGVVKQKVRRPASEAGSSTYAFDNGNVLYSKLRPYLNKVVCPDELGVATTELVPLRPFPSILDRRFLGHYLRSAEFLGFAQQCVAGVKMPRVIMDKFWAHLVPLPPLSEQRRIVEILDQADALRKLRAEADAKAERILSALFIKMFGDPATNPMGWNRVLLGELIVDGPQNGLYKPASAYGEGTRILRIDSFYEGRVTGIDRLKRVRLSDDEVQTYRLRPNDIVINRVNSEEYLGKSAIVPELDEPVVFESNMMRFAVDTTRVEPWYLIEHLQTSYTRTQMLRRSKRAINQASINQDDVRSLAILLPPVDEQHRSVRCLSRFIRTLGGAQESRQRITRLFDVLLHRAFSGDLTAKWREVHMQELLAEMEQQAKYLKSVPPSAGA